MNLKKLERYLRVNLLGPGPRLMETESTRSRSNKGWETLSYNTTALFRGQPQWRNSTPFTRLLVSFSCTPQSLTGLYIKPDETSSQPQNQFIHEPHFYNSFFQIDFSRHVCLSKLTESGEGGSCSFWEPYGTYKYRVIRNNCRDFNNMSASNELDYSVDVCRITKGCTYRAPARYVTKSWSVVLLNKKYIYCYLKCIVYDKLLTLWRLTTHIGVVPHR
jgi:hypothetical protein